MSGRLAALPRGVLVVVLTLLMAVGAVAGAFAGTARADSAPITPTDPATPPTVTADALPTVQVDGVVWSQVVVDNTVYVGGKFTSARPAGAPAGTNEVTRNNLLAYDIRTGELITSFAPDLNGQVNSVKASPDGSKIYVAGSFTAANGQTRYRLAAYDTATGALDPNFHPSMNMAVQALAVTGDTVYAGGNFSAAGTQTRTRLAAFSPTNGALLPWAPTADATVQALAVSPSGSKVIVGGSFTKLTSADGATSQTARGLGAVDVASGAPVPFAAGTVVNDTGSGSAILALAVDSDTVYASGYTFVSSPPQGSLEGIVAADPETGAVKWVDDCHGDTYSVWASGSLTYEAGHPHECSNIGGWPQTEPTWTVLHGIAFSKTATTTVGTETGNFIGMPAPALQNWFPDFQVGTVTGQGQATWSVAGNSQYVVYGGEFPQVNGADQQGLVRFAVPSIAPNKVGPQRNDQLTPTLSTPTGGVARVSWTATSDQDNTLLTYRVYRDGKKTTPVYTVSQQSTFWQRPTLSFTDSGLAAGTHSYVVTASDPFGNTVSSASATVTVAAQGSGSLDYSSTVKADGAQDYWRLDETSGSTAKDSAGSANLGLTNVGNGVTMGRAGAISGDADTAFQFTNSGRTSGYASTQTAIAGPNTFSEEAWFQTTSRNGGKIIAFGDKTTGNSSNYDRHVYMDGAGHVLFGVYPSQERVVSSNATYNDGKWHHVVASLSGSGMALYVDGTLVGSRSDTTTAQAYNGYWRIGGDSPWDGNGGYFTGLIDDVAVYPAALSSDQVQSHYVLGSTGHQADIAPTASFTASASGLTGSFDGTKSADADGTIASYAWNFGDGSTATGTNATHAFAGAGTYLVRLTVTDDKGATATDTQAISVTVPPPNQPPAAAFTSSAAGLTATVDASASADPDGSIASSAWSFGDGATGTGATARHTYAAAGTYTVQLTVTDDKGATGTVAHDVTVSAPTGTIAADGFDRTVASGLGTADSGGAWTTTGGASATSVGAGVGHVSVAKAGGKVTGYLAGVSQQDVATQASFTLPAMPTGAGVYLSVVGRHVGTSDYRAVAKVLANGGVTLGLSREDSGTETKLQTITVPGLTYTAGSTLVVRFQAAGTSSTALAAKLWVAGTPEPAGWQVTATDTAGTVTAAGSVGFEAYVSGSATTVPVRVDVDDVWAGVSGSTPVPAPAPNQAPSAAFTSSVSGHAVSVDGSASADADGSVAGYAWDFGDQTTGSGATTQHTYAAAGTYTVRLTVTDDDGATGTVTHDVTVTDPTPANTDQTLYSDSFDRTAASGLGATDPAGIPWTTTGTMSVSGGAGHVSVAKAGATASAYLNPVAVLDTDVQLEFTLPAMPTGGGTYLTLVARRLDNNDYRAVVKVKADGSVNLGVSRVVGGTETSLKALTVPGLTYVPGTALVVRLDVSGNGTSTVVAKTWMRGTAEPAAWQVTGTDTTADLQRAGGVGFLVYVSGSSTALPARVDVDNLWVGPAGTEPKDN